MELIGFLLQIPTLLGIALIIAFHLNAIIELWRNDYSRIFKVVWTVVIMLIPLVGAFLYYMFVSRAWREIVS